MKNLIITLFVFSFMLISCGKEAEDTKNAMEALKNLSAAGEKIEDSQKRAEEKLAERKAKGDTLAMHFSELQKYLPESIDGYKSETPEGETVNFGGFSLSTAKKVFTNGNQSIKIELFDYNANLGQYSLMTAWTTMKISRENANGYERSFNTGIKDVVGYEKYEKQNKRVEILYGLGYRFYLTIEGENIENPDVLKSITNKIDMKKLASM